MIKYIYLIKKKPEISEAEFRRHLESEAFDELLRRVVEKAGGHRIVKSIVLDTEFNKHLNEMRDVQETRYDAVIEYRISSGTGLEERIDNEEFRKFFSELETLQETFIDLKHSQRFFVEYQQLTSDD